MGVTVESETVSALPPKADIGTQSRNVRFVPKADMRASPARCRWTSRPRHQAHSLLHPAMPILAPSARDALLVSGSGEVMSEHVPSRSGVTPAARLCASPPPTWHNLLADEAVPDL